MPINKPVIIAEYGIFNFFVFMNVIIKSIIIVVNNAEII